MGDRVVLRQFSYRAEAEMVRELLEANDIDAFVVSDDCGAVDPALQFGRGANVLVAEGDVARANRLIDEVRAESEKTEEEP